MGVQTLSRNGAGKLSVRWIVREHVLSCKNRVNSPFFPRVLVWALHRIRLGKNTLQDLGRMPPPPSPSPPVPHANIPSQILPSPSHGPLGTVLLYFHEACKPKFFGDITHAPRLMFTRTSTLPVVHTKPKDPARVFSLTVSVQRFEKLTGSFSPNKECANDPLPSYASLESDVLWILTRYDHSSHLVTYLGADHKKRGLRRIGSRNKLSPMTHVSWNKNKKADRYVNNSSALQKRRDETEPWKCGCSFERE